MSLLALAAAALLTLTDPTGDAAGDGTLEPPTSPVYANAALFDLQEVSVVAGAAQGEPATLRVAMGAVELDESQPGGFNRSVVDVYLDVSDGGATATLQGPGMLMPPGRGWEYAVRISPRGAFGAPAPLDEGQPVEWSPLELAIDGDVFVVGLPDGMGADLDVFALSGVYDAFSPHSWRPLTASPSPWSYSGTEQVVPVVDLIAPDHETQMRALRDGVLPARARQVAGGLTWLLLSMAGVLIAATGLWLRRVAGAAAPATSSASVREATVQDTAEVPPDEADEAMTEPVETTAAETGSDEPVEVPVAVETASDDLVSGSDDVETTADEPVATLEEPELSPQVAAGAREDPVDAGTTALEGELADNSGEGVTAAPADDDDHESGPEDPGEPEGRPADDGDDRFERLRRDLEATEEPEDDLMGFTERSDKRARSLNVEHTDEDGGQAGS